MKSLRYKIYALATASAAIALLFTLMVTWRTTGQEFAVIERIHAEQALRIAQNALINEVDSLDQLTADWARWDDSYRFVMDRNDEYIQSNLNQESLELISVDSVFYINNNGELVYMQHRTSLGGVANNELRDGLMRYFGRDSQLVDVNDQKSSAQGMLTLGDRLLAVAAQPITTSDGMGERRGTLVMVRTIDAGYLQEISQLTGDTTTLSALGSNSENVDDTVKLDDLARESTKVVTTEGRVRAYQVVENIFGNPAFVLRIEYQPHFLVREDVLLKSQTLWYSLLILGAVVLFIVLLEIVVMRPLATFYDLVRQLDVLTNGESNSSDGEDLGSIVLALKNLVRKVEQDSIACLQNEQDIDRLRTAMDQAFEHMVITSDQGVILHANAAAERLTGFTRKEMLGKTPALWGRQMKDQFYREFWDTIRLHKKTFEGEIINRRKDGQKYRAMIRVAPILDDKKRVLYFIGVEQLIAEV